MAILLPWYLNYTLNEKSAPIFYSFGCNVLDIDRNLQPLEVGKQVIAKLEALFFNICELPKTLSALHGFVDLSKGNIVNIYRMCL